MNGSTSRRTSPFLIDMDDLDTIEVRRLDPGDRIEEKEKEVKSRIEQLNKAIYKELYRSLSDTELNDLLTRLRDNGDPENRIPQIEREIKRREEESSNPYGGRDNTYLTRRLYDINKELNERPEDPYSTDAIGYERLARERQMITEELQKRKIQEKSFDELLNERRTEEYNLRNVQRFKRKYEEELKIGEEFDAANDEKERRANNRPVTEQNRFTSMTDEELQREIDDLQAKVDRFQILHPVSSDETYEDNLVDLDFDIRKVSINGERTNNIVVGPGIDDFELSNGVYVSLENVKEAIEREFERIGPNRVVRCRRNRKTVNVDQIMNAVIEAAREDSRIEVGEIVQDSQYVKRRIGLNDRRDKEDNYFDRGEIIVPNDDLQEDYFIRQKIVEEVMKGYYIGKTGQRRRFVPPQNVDPIVIDRDEEARLIRDMLDRYYGNRKREKLYRKSMALYKSHIKKDSNGFMYVEDFPERETIEKEFHLEEYRSRLEAYSHYENGDSSKYEALLTAYEKIGFPFPLKPDGTEYTREEKINILVQEDAHYIETFNDNYNSYANTYLNLQTLGKDGEKKPYAHLESMRDENGHIKIKAVFSNAGKVVLNTGILALNVFKVYPNKFIGKFIVAPIQHLIHNSDKKAAGAYTNKRSHRYAQRRDMYEKEYQQALIQKYQREGRSLDNIRLIDKLKMTALARFNAIFHWKEGNKKVLHLGAVNIRAGLEEKVRIEQLRRNKQQELERDNERCQTRAAEIRQRLGQNPAQEERDRLTEELNGLNTQLAENRSNLASLPTGPIRGFKTNQTDAVNSEVHDKANKDNITHVVHGVKLVGRVLIAKVAIPKLIDKVTTTTTTRLPGTTKIVSTKNIDPQKVSNLTMKDLIDAGDKSGLNYDTLGAVPKKVQFTDDYVRGFHFKFGGKYLSGTDGVGYNVFKTGSPISTVKLSSPLGKDSKLCDVVASIVNQSGNGPITPMEVAKKLSQDPKVLSDFLDSSDTWLSSSATGIARGWQAGGSIAGLDVMGTKVVSVPGKIISTTSTISRTNPGVATVLGADALGLATDIYDDARRTLSQEEMIQEGVSKKTVDKIPSAQATAKEPERDVNPEHAHSEWAFTGTKKGDYAIDYNEADMAQQASVGGRRM